MNIFILEDNLFQQQRLERIVKFLTLKHQIRYKSLFSTAKPDHLLAQIDLTANHHIYFLDLEINNEAHKGLSVAKEIRKKDPYGTIVFVTTHSELAPTTFAYRVAALDFIEKDLAEEQFILKVEQCLLIADKHRTIPVCKDNFSFENKYASFQIPFSDILYFETIEIAHKIRLKTKSKVIGFYAELKEIEQYDDRLFRCHRAFVVNLANVRSIDKKNKLVLFDHDESCLVSRRLQKEMITKLEALSRKELIKDSN
ncbi:response regulator transcription factor [Paenibacillus sp. GSMTC-2017]|uniref:response regulator transcription factor n=1 Tax=Paenibacillus sp. GSMTC-2017 TaxID=2794350 RepID=UPI0018D87E7A|nr:response regulator transcription factor [Paenibacillus sp. GSMTC-2017]MBH5318046.1 response regulator transcription factor [Paenibacillus sp. GSMTC-2017]